MKTGESRRFLCGGRQQSRLRQGKQEGHHRGLRPGHVLKGVARELGRSECFLVKKDGIGRSSASEIPALVRRVLPIDEFRISGYERDKRKDGRCKVLGEDSEERTNLR